MTSVIFHIVQTETQPALCYSFVTQWHSLISSLLDLGDTTDSLVTNRMEQKWCNFWDKIRRILAFSPCSLGMLDLWTLHLQRLPVGSPSLNAATMLHGFKLHRKASWGSQLSPTFPPSQPNHQLWGRESLQLIPAPSCPSHHQPFKSSQLKP